MNMVNYYSPRKNLCLNIRHKVFQNGTWCLHLSKVVQINYLKDMRNVQEVLLL